MAASNSENSGSGKKNFYNFSYGKLTTKQREIPAGFEEIKETDLKSKMDKVEQVDLRNKYINKGSGERPYSVFYDNITGVITGFEVSQTDKGKNLVIEILDNDGDTSLLQCKLYGKYTENLLSRLVSVKPTDSIYFYPYAIPSTSKDEATGKEFSFYNQGVSITVAGKKIPSAYNKDNDYKVNGKELPKTERIANAEGELVTSRVNRVNFLYAEFSEIFKNLVPVADIPKSAIPTASPAEAFEPAPKGKVEMKEPVADAPGFQQLPF